MRKLNSSVKLRAQGPSAESTSSCPLVELPIEIMEMIIGEVSITDLENLLESSPVIRVCNVLNGIINPQNMFEYTRYGRQYHVVREHEREVYSSILEKWEAQPQVHRNTHDVLRAFTHNSCYVVIFRPFDILSCSVVPRHLISSGLLFLLKGCVVLAFRSHQTATSLHLPNFLPTTR